MNKVKQREEVLDNIHTEIEDELKKVTKKRSLNWIKQKSLEHQEKQLMRKIGQEMDKLEKHDGEYPMPGDIVKMINNNDCLIDNKNPIGVIGGMIGEKKESYDIIWNFNCFKNGKVSRASGGPGYYVNASKLKKTKEKKEVKFWKFRRNHMKANNGIDYLQEKRVWLLDFNDIE